MSMSGSMGSSLGLYIHWPFCKAKCPYCDFNSHVREQVDEAAWCAALLAEMRHWAAQSDSRQLHSIFFGGGTPSLMPARTVAALIEEAQRLWQPQEGLEITLEANPTSVEAGKLRDFRAAGVNRLSLGIQSLRAADLKALGRQHSADEARAALALAAQIFPRFSFDLIYARPAQQLADWLSELEEALAFAPAHLSAYQLTIEPGTQFHTLHQRGELVIPDEELASEMYTATGERLAAAGLQAYEVSNYARLGHECRHNLGYWRYEDYVGIGPGAHGRISVEGRKLATRTHRAPEEWLARVQASGHGGVEAAPVPPQDQRDEMLLMGLRLAEGIALDKLAAYGLQLDSARTAPLLKHGLISLDNNRLTATPEGRLRLNALIAALA